MPTVAPASDLLPNQLFNSVLNSAPNPVPNFVPNVEPFPDHHNDLAGTLKFAWQMLGRGVHDRRSAFHTPVLATQSPSGPEARVLVMRALDVDTRTLTFHTDTRSPKLLQLQADNRVALTFYDAPRKTQLRLNGSARLHVNDALSQRRFKGSRPSSLRCFLGAAPGVISPVPASGLPADLEGREPEWAELHPAEANFAVLNVAVHQLEWLHLHTAGQRRALFKWADGLADCDCAMQWLNP